MPLVGPVRHHDCVESVAVVQEVTQRGQEVTQEGGPALGHENTGVEGLGPLSVARPIGAQDGRVAQQLVRQATGPYHVTVLVHPAVLLQNLNPATENGTMYICRI